MTTEMLTAVFSHIWSWPRFLLHEGGAKIRLKSTWQTCRWTSPVSLGDTWAEVCPVSNTVTFPGSDLQQHLCPSTELKVSGDTYWTCWNYNILHVLCRIVTWELYQLMAFCDFSMNEALWCALETSTASLGALAGVCYLLTTVFHLHIHAVVTHFSCLCSL